MDRPFELTRPRPARSPISLAPMIDIMMILLVFFMVTSTYLDLDMIPAVDVDDGPSAATTAAPADTMLIRLGADGRPALQGRAVELDTLAAMIGQTLEQVPLTQIVILPSGAADTQALVSVMDTATKAGATRLRVVRLEPRP